MQFSLFGAEAALPLLEDLSGLVLAGGDWVVDQRGPVGKDPDDPQQVATASGRRTDGSTARLSVLVPDAWRAAALIDELAVRGLSADIAAAPGALIAVRTEHTVRLTAMAASWRRGASLIAPTDFALTPSGLRLWAIAVGRSDDQGYLLTTHERNQAAHLAAGKQLARLGVTAVEITRQSGPGWRVTSRRRLRRLLELLGQPPAGAPHGWETR